MSHVALFAGPPGTGKALAAESIAREIGVDLFRVDLAKLSSKYIGETEKNLTRVFAEASESHAILLFDEADALFGKRAGVRDAQDRYANLESSYLLQLIEEYPGVVLLTTNSAKCVDDAFVRRLDLIIEFPVPADDERVRIWASRL